MSADWENIPRCFGIHGPAGTPKERVDLAVIDHLERGRTLCRRRAWGDACTSLRLADEAAPLAGGDLELLATSAYLTGWDSHFCPARPECWVGSPRRPRGAGP